MRRIASRLQCLVVLLLALNFLALSAWSSGASTQTRRHSSSGFAAWMSTTSFYQPVYAPSSPDNWLGGTGNWSNVADWSAGEPGSGSDVFINTGNDNVTLDVNAYVNSLTLGGTSGSSTLTGSGHYLTIAGALTINQSGTLTFAGSVIHLDGSATNAGTINLSQGAGINATNFTNSGTINLMGASLEASQTFTNSGNIVGLGQVDSASSGGDFNNASGILVYNLNVGGTLTNQTSGGINVQSLTVNGNLINQGQVSGLMRNSIVIINGELINSGRFYNDYSSATVGSLNNSGIIFAGGGFTVQGNATNTGIINETFLAVPELFEVDGTLTNTGGSISVQGTDDNFYAATLVNSGTIDVEQNASFVVHGEVTNSGTIMSGVQQGRNGLSSGSLNNQVGGVFQVGGMGDVATINSVMNAGSLMINNGALLSVGGSHAPTTAVPGVLNSGTVTIAHGGTLASPPGYSQTAGQTTVDGLLLVAGRPNILFSGGAVYGNEGTLQGNVISNAAFNMGDMPMTVGMMAITGNYSQGANGSIAFDIASVTSFDQLNVTGHASLNGTLYVDLLNGYVPQIGNMFDIMNFGSRSGTFSMTVGLPINNQEHFVLEYNSTNLTLDVVSGPDNQSQSGHGSAYYEPYISEITGGVDRLDNFSSPGATAPEPGSLVLLASGLLGIAGVRRKKI